MANGQLTVDSQQGTQAVPNGYKRTEVGVIPKEWDVGSLGRFWSVTDCKHVTAEFIPDGFPIASIKEVQSRFVDLAEAKQTTQFFYKLLIEGGRKPQAGDLIISRNATVGEIAQVAEWHPPFAMGQDVCLLRKKSQEFSTEFIQAVFQSPVVANQLANLMVGSTFKRANVEQIRNFFVPMPPRPEQRAIAEALSDVDELLGALDRLIAKKRDLKQAAMQQLLTGQTRLPGFQGEWEVKRLGDLFEITSSKRVFQSEWKAEGIPFYRARELAVLGEAGRVDNELFINRELYEKHRRAYGVPRGGDMLVTGVGTLGKVYVVLDDREFYFKDGNIIWFKIEGKMSAEFLRQLYLTEAVQRQVAEGGAGTTVGTYTISAAKKTTIPFPLIAEQTAIAEALSDMDAELAALEKRRDKTRALKQGMMQELLTGRIRLPF